MSYSDFLEVFVIGILSAIVCSILIYQFIKIDDLSSRIKDLEKELDTYVDENRLKEQIKSLQEQINKYKNDDISS